MPRAGDLEQVLSVDRQRLPRGRPKVRRDVRRSLESGRPLADDQSGKRFHGNDPIPIEAITLGLLLLFIHQF